MVVVVIESLGLGYFAYKTFSKKEETKEIKETLVQEQSEKEEVKNELAKIYEQYESLKSTNTGLSAKLEAEQERISKMMNELKYVKSSDKAKLKQLKEETETLKKIMKDFVRQIDQLNTENKKLSSEKEEAQANYENQVAKTDSLNKEKEDLALQVKIAKKIKVKSITVNPLNKRDKETARARKVRKIKVNFQLGENELARKGKRAVFIRIASPDGIILMNDASGIFTHKGKELMYSAKREVDYQGKTIQTSVFMETREEQLPGKYSVDIFVDGNAVGEQSFHLK